MPRIVKEHEYAEKRNEILDSAQRLMTTKGYAQMTIQDILDDLQISKGAFYHYFSSKQALLEGMIDRMVDQSVQLHDPIIHDPDLPALEKLRRFFDATTRWKTSQKSFLIALMRVWYNDDNALVRQKVTAMGLKRIAELLAPIIRQGVAEGVFTIAYPDEVSSVIITLLQNLSNALAERVLEYEGGCDEMPRIERIIAAHTGALERVLGVPAGSLEIAPVETMREWLLATGEKQAT
jgi:AcrR family transcriptional regulator